MSSTTLDLAWVKPYRATFAEHAQSSIDGFRAHVEEHQTWLSSFLEDAMKKVEEGADIQQLLATPSTTMKRKRQSRGNALAPTMPLSPMRTVIDKENPMPVKSLVASPAPASVLSPVVNNSSGPATPKIQARAANTVTTTVTKPQVGSAVPTRLAANLLSKLSSLSVQKGNASENVPASVQRVTPVYSQTEPQDDRVTPLAQPSKDNVETPASAELKEDDKATKDSPLDSKMAALPSNDESFTAPPPRGLQPQSNAPRFSAASASTPLSVRSTSATTSTASTPLKSSTPLRPVAVAPMGTPKRVAALQQMSTPKRPATPMQVKSSTPRSAARSTRPLSTESEQPLTPTYVALTRNLGTPVASTAPIPTAPAVSTVPSALPVRPALGTFVASAPVVSIPKPAAIAALASHAAARLSSPLPLSADIIPEEHVSSDEDDDDDDDDMDAPPAKKIKLPAWALPEALERAMELQEASRADEIFGAVRAPVMTEIMGPLRRK